MKPLNIVYINSHDTGRYIQPYGYGVSTPRLQKFAEEGVLFRNAFTNNPTCSPSRACLATGQYAHTNGMLGLAHRGGTLNDPTHTLANFLKSNGYQTALAGFQHLAKGTDSPLGLAPLELLGYTEDYQEKRQRYITDSPANGGVAADTATVRVAKEFLRDRNLDKPFFLDVGFFTTHRTGKTGAQVQWHNDDESPMGDPRYVRGPSCLPDTPEVREDFADFKVAATRLDDYMGEVIDAIDDAGLADSTIILVTTDHGIAYPHMKCHLTDHGTGVMLMLRGPAASPITGGKVVDPLVQQIDLFPTLCDLAGLDQPDWLQGKSWLPLLKGEADRVHDAVFMEVNNHAAHEPKRTVRADRYRYVRRYDGRDKPVLPNIDDSVSKDQWLESGGVAHGVASESLFDLYMDPNEANNRINDPTLADVLADLRGKLDEWMKSTDDPALGETLDIRKGYSLNDADAMSPAHDPATLY